MTFPLRPEDNPVSEYLPYLIVAAVLAAAYARRNRYRPPFSY